MLIPQTTAVKEPCRVAIQAPTGPWLWSQHWRDLLFSHWQVPVAALRLLLPDALDVDSWDGMGWVSAVSFRLRGVRPRWLPPLRPVSNFIELNLRTYVLHRGEPAIYFLSIHANKRSVMHLTRWLTPLRYEHARMRYLHRGGEYYFESQRSTATGDVAFAAVHAPTSIPRTAPAGSLDAWLLERYCVYAADRHGSLRRTVADHPPWQYQDAAVTISINTLGRPFGLDLSRTPDRVHFSAGVHSHLWQFGVV